MVKRWMVFMVFLFSVATALAAPSPAANAQAVVVGRVSYIEGDLLRYVPAENDWVAVVQDAPFGTGDTLFSGNQGMSELIVPNGSWVRTGNSTQVQFIALDADVSEMDVASGVARFYNKSSKAVVKVTSPFGYVLAYPGSIFDFYVGENSIELIAVKGNASFIHSSTQGRYDVAAGSPSLLADQSQVSSGEGVVDPNWDQWNRNRDDYWASKARVRGRSAEYLPPSLQDEAYTLEENGRWETVVYEGKERRFWRPTGVAAGWAPFTVGRWTEWEGDQTWVPAEPFGYVTHHYGNWVLVGDAWFWAPPVAAVRVGLPLLDIGFFWTPGRVSWIHSGSYVGWVPLAPSEPYYSHRHWGGRHDIVITKVTQVNISVRNYAYARHAVVVNQNNFYGVNNYRNVRVTNINQTTIINNYRAAPVINNTVINNYNTNRQRFNFTNAVVREKPHNTVISRIQQNEKVIRQGKRENAALIEQQVKKMPEGKINRQARIEQPKATNYIVPANQVNKPKSEVKLPQKEIKPAVKGGPQGQQGQPGKPGQVAPAKPGQITPPTKPGPQGQPGQVAPAKPGQPGQITPPSRPGQQGPQGQPGQVTPAKPGQVTPPGRPGQLKPLEPGQQPGVVPPTPKPGQQGPQGQPGQVMPPSRPGQTTPAVKADHPAQPGPATQQPKPAPQPTPHVQPAPQPKPVQQPAPQPKPAPQVQPAPQPKPAPQPVAQPKPAPQPAPKPQPAAQPKPAPQPHAPAKPGQQNQQGQPH